MKVNKENIEEQLQELLDARSNEGQVSGLVNEAEKDLHLLKETDQYLRSIDVQSPRKGFTDRVIQQLNEQPLAQPAKKQGLLIFIGVIMVLMIMAFYLNSVNSTLISLPEDVSVVGKSFNLQGVGSMLDAGLIIKGLMFITFFLAMLLFDRAILRPLFNKRRNFG